MSNYKHNATVFKALCDESRLRIIDLVKRGETCSCVLLENLTISQSTLSHHMKILVDSGLVISRKDGKKTMYSISKSSLKDLQRIVSEIFDFEYNNTAGCECKAEKQNKRIVK